MSPGERQEGRGGAGISMVGIAIIFTDDGGADDTYKESDQGQVPAWLSTT